MKGTTDKRVYGALLFSKTTIINKNQNGNKEKFSPGNFKSSWS